jgi:nitroreductase
MPEGTEIIQTTRAIRRLKPGPVPDELIRKILEASVCAANGGNTQRWRFLVIKDPKINKQVQVYYKRAFDEVIGPRYLASAPPPGVTRERYARRHAAVEYLTEHFHEAPVWIVACLDEGAATPTRSSGASIYPAVQNMLLAARAHGLGSTLTTPTSFTRRARKPRWVCRPVSRSGPVAARVLELRRAPFRVLTSR